MNKSLALVVALLVGVSAQNAGATDAYGSYYHSPANHFSDPLGNYFNDAQEPNWIAAVEGVHSREQIAAEGREAMRLGLFGSGEADSFPAQEQLALLHRTGEHARGADAMNAEATAAD